MLTTLSSIRLQKGFHNYFEVQIEKIKRDKVVILHSNLVKLLKI